MQLLVIALALVVITACDPPIDEETGDTSCLSEAQTAYTDADGDGFGDPTTGTAVCAIPEGSVADGTDCDDTNGAINPGATEACNGIDDNCVGGADDGVVPTWYADADKDGSGDDASAIAACAEPDGYLPVGGDCNDNDAGINPDALEVCDDTGVDEDCDDLVDDADSSVTGTSPWYRDADSDGFGDPATAVMACHSDGSTISDGTDCNDADNTIHTGCP